MSRSHGRGGMCPEPVEGRLTRVAVMSEDAEQVRVEVSDGIAVIRLDRPKMNALNADIQRRIGEAALQVDQRDDVAAVVLTGGEQVFAAGADIKEMVGLSYADMVRQSVVLQDTFSAVAGIGKPVVAAVNGYALGGGCELALCADIRIAADDAVLGQPEIKLGIIPGAGGTQRLSRLIGPAKAKELIFTGRFVQADEALRIGLVDQVVPAAAGAAHRAWRGRSSSSADPRWRCERPSSASTPGSGWTSPPAWRSNGRSSPDCSPPRTGSSG